MEVKSKTQLSTLYSGSVAAGTYKQMSLAAYRYGVKHTIMVQSFIIKNKNHPCDNDYDVLGTRVHGTPCLGRKVTSCLASSL